jgi:hypothetical protein
MPNIQHKRGTRAALDALASSSALLPWQLYGITDESQIALATSASTYVIVGAGGGAGYHVGPTAPDPEDFPLWFNTEAGAFLVWVGSTWVEPGDGGILEVSWDDVTGKPTTFPPSAHTHTAEQISDSTAAGRAILTAADADAQRAALSVETTTQLNARDTANRDRANHTGTQAASTITGLATVATSGSAADLGSGILPAARFNDTAHGNRAGGTLHAAATGSVAGFMSAADKTKLDGVATGATANATDAALRDRATHTGTQAASTISDFNSASRAQAEAAILPGSNISITPASSGATRTLTVAVTGLGSIASRNITIGTTAPASPAVGDIWVDTN